jgi:chemotaxis response regulator CheB
VITVFLRSLTQHWGGKLIAVIVSGYDGDGAAALCGIKEVGGVTIAQKLDTAGYARECNSQRVYRFCSFT